MIEIDGMLVTDTWTEYAVEPTDGIFMDCDSLAEARDIARLWGAPVLKRRCYMTEWEETSDL